MVVKESISRDLMRLFVWYPLRWLIIILPIRSGIAVMRLMGDLHFRFSRGKSRLLEENLSFIKQAGVSCPKRAIREYFRNHYIDRLLIFIFQKLGKDAIKRNIEITGLSNLDTALKNGKGVVLVHGHFGPVHLPLVALARLGYGMKQIGLPSDEGLSWIGKNVAFRLRMKYEGMMPAEIIMADSFLRGAFKWLADNGVLMITGDGTGTENRVGRHATFDIFGRPALFPLGPALLAKKTGAAMIPMFIVPGENGCLYRIVIEKAVEGNDAESMTREFVAKYESYVSRHPGYMHFLDRFRQGEFLS